MERRFWMKPLLAILLVAMLALAGCSGDDGATGPKGDTGDTGPAGPVTTTSEACNVCHGAGAIGDVADIHTTDAPVTVTVDAVGAALSGGHKVITVDFTVENDGDGVTGLDLSDINFYLADIVPAGTDTAVSGTWPTAYLERWAYERADSTNSNGTSHYVQGTLVDNGDGTYTYTCATTYDDGTFNAALAGFSHGGDALAAETLATVAPELDIYNHTQRVIVRVGSDSTAGYAGTVGVQDFTVADGGVGVADTVTAVDAARVLAPITGCKECHSDNMQQAAHASSYPDTRACNVCHSPISGWPHSANADGTGYLEGGNVNAYGEDITADGAWLTKFIHQLHKGNAWFEDPTDWEITYPENIKNCAKCHNGDDNMTDAWKTNPTKEACTACHIVAADAHPNDQADDSLCSSCHTSGSNIIGGTEVGITAVHTVTYDQANAVNYTTTIALSADTAGTAGDDVYETGDAPLITITVAKNSDNSDVGGYTTGDYNADTNPTGVYNDARVYIYGPLDNPRPALATGTQSDPNFDATTDTPTQSHDLYTGGDDAQVQTDADGLKYQTLAITDDLTPGTYAILARIGVGSDSNERAWAIKEFQIGTSTATKKVADTMGDSCSKCHDIKDYGSTAHRAFFGTDGCLACHDQSGNHADPIANRVHAVHSAQGPAEGDLNTGRDWSDVTYPSNLTNCEVCHISGNTSYKATSDDAQPANWGIACYGCHGSTPGAKDHILQNGGTESFFEE